MILLFFEVFSTKINTQLFKTAFFNASTASSGDWNL
ncbi:unnamed protein product [Acanthoscelides obtectus]|uniref:Uncharacterized protein n=1 Tax=Acanthoscelides obtectus TaxID=200917 RepID=A0A9P0PKB3_ACAOB|nr:unnamed protein product [Acanthoscelides obtectus]CAK1629782.1 hypothetical protein AOBTE_LOCUS5952 [Acanthoscelides obtectus]